MDHCPSMTSLLELNKCIIQDGHYIVDLSDDDHPNMEMVMRFCPFCATRLNKRLTHHG